MYLSTYLIKKDYEIDRFFSLTYIGMFVLYDAMQKMLYFDDKDFRFNNTSPRIIPAVEGLVKNDTRGPFMRKYGI